MAQLPPKVPNIVAQEEDHHHLHHNQNNVNDDQCNEHQWMGFSHGDNIRLPPPPPPPQNPNPNPSWVDEFIEFSATKREAQRRLASDLSVAFIETNGGFHDNNNKGGGGGGGGVGDHFDKFDDEQFMSMFGTELGSSTSDHNSTNDDEGQKQWGSEGEVRERKGEEEKGVKKNEAEEVESSCKMGDNNTKEVQFQGHQAIGNDNNDTVAPSNSNNVGGDDQQVIDPKRVKRILANRQSAQRSRVRKLQYISELERSVTALQSEVSMLTPRVAFLDHQRMILNVDNSALKAKIAALAQDKIFKDAHQEALKREIERLRQVYYQQQQNGLKKTEDTLTTSSSSLPSQPIHQPPPDIKETEADHPFIG